MDISGFIVGTLFWTFGTIMFSLLLFFWYYSKKIKLMLEKYPGIKSKMLVYQPNITRPNSIIYKPFINPYHKKIYLIRLKIIFKQIFFFESFFKDRFDKTFDRLYSYEEIKKTKDTELIKLVDKQRLFFRIWLFILNLIFFLFLLVGVILLILITLSKFNLL